MEESVIEILNIVNEMGVDTTQEQLKKRSRQKGLVFRRALVAYGLNSRGYGLSAIGSHFGYKAHASVINLLKYPKRKFAMKEEYNRITPFLKSVSAAEPNHTLESKIKYHKKMEKLHRETSDRLITLLQEREK